MSEHAQNLSRRFRIILGISLALNLLVGGIIVGAFVFGDHRGHAPRMTHMIGPLSHALSEEDRDAVGRKLRHTYKAQGERKVGKKAYRKEIRALADVLMADSFDAAQAQQHLEKMNTLLSGRIVRGRQVLLEQFAEMTPEARQAYAKRLLQHKHR